MNLNNTSLLLQRSLADLHGRILIANAEDTFAIELAQQAQVSVWCQSATVYDALRQRGCPVETLQLSAVYSAQEGQEFDHIILYQPKAKELLDYLLAATMPRLRIGGKVWLVGENKSGVKSAYTRLDNMAQAAGKVDAAKHCLLYNATKAQASPTFVFEQWLTQTQHTVAGQTVTLCSLPGVFGHGKVDKGTLQLLDALQKHRFMADVKHARMLDFGCGDGIIALWLHLHTGAKVTALDDSALAICATTHTFVANHAEAALTTLLSNGFNAVKGRFNYVVTNPPFHTGTSTDYSVVETFFSQVKQHLTLNGELFVVANDFLRYPELLDAALGKHTRLQRQQGFAIYHARQVK